MKTAKANPKCRRENCGHPYSDHRLNGECLRLRTVGMGKIETCYCGGFLRNKLITIVKRIFRLKESQIKTRRL